MTILSVLSNISVIAASAAALWGINSWRHEHIGKGRAELAEEGLAMFYEARDIITDIRRPFPHEADEDIDTSETERSENRTPNEARNVISRYQHHQEFFAKLKAARYRFIAKFGKDAEEPFNKIDKIIRDIFGAARSYTRYKQRFDLKTSRTEDQRNQLIQKMEEAESIFWYGGETDPIQHGVERILEEVETFYRDIIILKNRPPWLSRWIKRI